MKRTVTRRGIERRYKHLGISDVAAPDGWLEIVEDCLAEIDRHTPDAERGSVYVSDIKEKRGRLVVMVHAGDWADLITDLFEEMSTTTCVVCSEFTQCGSSYCYRCKNKKG